MQRFEMCNAKSCIQELLALGQISMKMWYLFEWLREHGELRHGTQAEIVKLYVDDELVAYSLLENYAAHPDKVKPYQGKTYQELGVVHFVTLPEHRYKGYASVLADKMYTDIIAPLLAQYSDVMAYIIATGRAVPLMQRTDIKSNQLVTQFYSELTFEKKVVIPLTIQNDKSKL